MSLRILMAACACLATAALAAEPPAMKIGSSWTFEAYNGYKGNGAKKAAKAYRLEVTDVSPNGITTRISDLTDGWVSDERYASNWNPESASGVAIQPYVFALGFQGFSDLLPPNVGWHKQPVHRESAYSDKPQAQRYQFSPAYPEFPDRLEPGTKWRGTATARDENTGQEIHMKIEGWVEARERLSVPAGDFDTVKLVRHTYLGDGNSWHTPTLVVSKEWYAPALGRSVRYETRAQYDELDSIDPTTDYGDWMTYQLVSYQTP
jgi:hypothetical protein